MILYHSCFIGNLIQASSATVPSQPSHMYTHDQLSYFGGIHFYFIMHSIIIIFTSFLGCPTDMSNTPARYHPLHIVQVQPYHSPSRTGMILFFIYKNENMKSFLLHILKLIHAGNYAHSSTATVMPPPVLPASNRRGIHLKSTEIPYFF